MAGPRGTTYVKPDGTSALPDGNNVTSGADRANKLYAESQQRVPAARSAQPPHKTTPRGALRTVGGETGQTIHANGSVTAEVGARGNVQPGDIYVVRSPQGTSFGVWTRDADGIMHTESNFATVVQDRAAADRIIHDLQNPGKSHINLDQFRDAVRKGGDLTHAGLPGQPDATVAMRTSTTSAAPVSGARNSITQTSVQDVKHDGAGATLNNLQARGENQTTVIALGGNKHLVLSHATASSRTMGGQYSASVVSGEDLAAGKITPPQNLAMLSRDDARAILDVATKNPSSLSNDSLGQIVKTEQAEIAALRAETLRRTAELDRGGLRTATAAPPAAVTAPTARAADLPVPNGTAIPPLAKITREALPPLRTSAPKV